MRYRDRRGREQLVRADREVILAAGAIGSPQLLMLSGIGPADHLREVGVTVAHDLPGVGENLQDHPYVVCIWESTVGDSLYGADKPKPLLEWLLRRSGPLTSSVAEAFAFVRSRPGLPAPDLQFHFAPAYFNDNGFDEYDGPRVHARPGARDARRAAARSGCARRTRAPSRGSSPTRCRSRRTCRRWSAGMRLAREIAAAEPLAEAAGRELFPGEGVDSDEDLAADLRRRVDLLYHPVGTCKMGSGEDAVVDAELRVRGVEGLRVADASIMPVIPGGNTNAPAIMVGERAADLIRGLSAA